MPYQLSGCGCLLDRPLLVGVVRTATRIRIALQLDEELQVLRCDRVVFHDVRAVGVAEDAVLGEVGRAEQHRRRLALLGQDQELVVHQRAVGARRAHGLDAGKIDGVLVFAVRAGFVVDVVEHDLDRRTALLRGVQRLEHRRPLKLVEGALQPESLALGAFDEGDDALDQAS